MAKLLPYHQRPLPPVLAFTREPGFWILAHSQTPNEFQLNHWTVVFYAEYGDGEQKMHQWIVLPSARDATKADAIEELRKLARDAGITAIGIDRIDPPVCARHVSTTHRTAAAAECGFNTKREACHAVQRM